MKENKHPEWNTGFRERTSYYVYCVGQNGIYTLVSTFLSTYLLFSGINPAISAAVLFAVKIWDAVNDALFGVIFDKLRFKSGKKHIPWLKLSSVLVPIATVKRAARSLGSPSPISFGTPYIRSATYPSTA